MRKTYDFYVKEGKKLLHATYTHQATIAYYASCVCDISHGGRSGSKYTLTQYANDIGMHRKTLSEWSVTYRNVIQKLELDPSDITKDQWFVATRVSNLLRDEKRQIQAESGLQRRKGRGWSFNVHIPVDRVRDLFSAEMNGRTAQSEINGYCDTVINIKNKLRRMEMSSVSEVSIRSLKMSLDEASSELTNYLMNNKGATMAELQGATI